MLKARLALMQLLQFFVWGAWLLTIGAYWFQTKQWSGAAFGALFSTMGIAAIVTPPVAGVIADRFLRADRLYALLHALSGLCMLCLPVVDDPNVMFWVLLAAMLAYMPTIALSISVSYSALAQAGLDRVLHFPGIRVFGTVGFIAALWLVSLTGLETSALQFVVSGVGSLVLSAYSLSLPPCRPASAAHEGQGSASGSVRQSLGLLMRPSLRVFFVFAVLLGAALQLTNAYGDTFLHDFASIPQHREALAVRYPAILMSLSQVSEMLFILAIPFFLSRLGIKKVMLMSMVAWVLRFGLFACGDPGARLWMLILSCVVYGVAFDFFNISASLFVETSVEPELRSSAQGLFMMMTNGVGATLGSRVSGWLIDSYFVSDGHFVWPAIWLTFAIYSAIIAVLFAALFRYRHEPVSIHVIAH